MVAVHVVLAVGLAVGFLAVVTVVVEPASAYVSTVGVGAAARQRLKARVQIVTSGPET